MKIKYIALFVYIVVMILAVYSQGSTSSSDDSDIPPGIPPYGTVEKCSMDGITSNFIAVPTDTTPLKNPILANNTCQNSHPEYSQLACCDYNQTLILKDNMVIAATIFSRCPACLYNVWDFWCASSCSPYQSSFMVPIAIDNTTTPPKITEVDFIIDPEYAEGFFNSCRDITSMGAPPFGTMFPTPEKFFPGVFAANPAFKVNYKFHTGGYKNSVIPCKDSCACDSCRDSCITPDNFDDIGINKTLPTTYLFDKELPFLSIWMIWTFIMFTLAILSVVSIFKIYRHDVKHFKNSKQKLIFTIGIVLLYFTAIGIPFISGAAPPHKTSCTWKMPGGSEWDCYYALGLSIYVLVALFAMFLLFLIISVFDKTPRKQSRSYRPIPGYSSMASVFDADSVADSPNDMSPVLQGNSSSMMSGSGASGNDDLSFIQRFFYWYGHKVASRPILVILVCLLFTIACSFGILMLEIEEDPIKLWVSPDSRAAQEKAYFDENFGPFYRVEQLIITPKNNTLYPNVIQKDLLAQLITLETNLMSASAIYQDELITIHDLCFQPTHKGCLIESVTGLWQRNLTNLQMTTNVTDYYISCQSNLLNAECMDAVGTPVNPSVVLGGWTNNSLTAQAFVVTFLLNNQPANLNKAMAWEQSWLNIVVDFTNNPASLFNVAYSSERSIQDELARESAADISTILISYSVMFFYISFALGRYYPLPSRFLSIFVNSRFALGFSGILIVACSIVISVGLCSFMHIKATLIISEVIPFLVLAIGVDNIFIIVNTFESLHVTRYDPNTKAAILPTPEDSLARTMVKVGPSIALASLSESLAFLLGSLTKMPAVQAFTFYAAIAIFFDFLLQISAFASLLVLDSKRTDSRRIDCIPCIRLNDGDNSDDEDDERSREKEPFARANIDATSLNTYKLKSSSEKRSGLLKILFKKYYAPFIVHPITKIIVIILFVGMLLAGINFAFQIELGLDQRVALPRDSYLQAYFDEMNEYLEAGPPMYIVVKGNYNYTDVIEQNALCTVGGCNNNSIINVYNTAPYMLHGISSWLDDYISWSQNAYCCFAYPNGTYCDNGDPSCINCFPSEQSGRPPANVFVEYLPNFFNYTINGLQCPITGLAYQSDTNIQNGNIVASRFDGYHTPLKTQNDFINAMKTAYYVADQSDLDIFPYSVFYVFFEQYLYIINIAVTDILLALAGVFVVSLLVLANPVAAVLVVVCVGLVCVDLLGVMTIWNVNLNAVSVVNVVMAVGISIEFCVHVAHAFVRAPKHLNRDEKAKYAVSEMGSSIISGIFITKLLGVTVLGFSRSEIFQVYYFRMYITIVILGALHGLVLLPVLLSLFGFERLNFENLFKKKEKLEIN
ncbi:hypothetical protein CYY_006086 [Polysphondylium violaceum]|uniref:SSD domain-containing protein n=1 Tax=Polysphondylium violaceum TaxID=133409 RepID=A0A8J4PU29_9MYCE|nr:hypothetical protein CYY_006086 [Polysphondylium violaceum]